MSIHKKDWLLVSRISSNTSRCLEIASQTTYTTRGIQKPTNFTELRSFLDICNALRRLVECFARQAASLKNKLWKNKPTKFGLLTEKGLKTMNALEEALVSPPVLAWSNSTGNMTFNTDVCDKQVRRVLLQEQEDKTTWPIGYWSCAINDSELKTTQHRETV